MARKRTIAAGNVRVAVLFGLEERILARVRAVITNILPELLARAKAKVAGAFKEPTGRMLNSLKAEAYESERGPKGRVFSDWYVSSFHEFGYGGKPAKVKAHRRRAEGFGGALARRKRRSNGETPEGHYEVRAHTRNIAKRKGRWLLKAALDEMAPTIRGALETAVRRGN